MTESKDKTTSVDLSNTIVLGIKEKKGKDIKILDLRGINNAVTDFFVICSGTSDTQVESIADSIDEQVSKHLSENAWHKEGFKNREWVLIDYVNVVVHIFKADVREFYGLEDLWGDATITAVDEA